VLFSQLGKMGACLQAAPHDSPSNLASHCTLLRGNAKVSLLCLRGSLFIVLKEMFPSSQFCDGQTIRGFVKRNSIFACVRSVQTFVVVLIGAFRVTIVPSFYFSEAPFHGCRAPLVFGVS